MPLDTSVLIQLHAQMLLSRTLDEILAQTRILGNPFYIGSTFEEPLVAIGLQMRCGSGLDHDVLAAYYRSLPILIGMGAEPLSIMRQAAMSAQDPFSAGRQMVNHFSEPMLNIMPVSSCVTVEAGKGFAAALIQKMHASEPVLTVVHLGDAMCAEADYWVMLQEIALRQLPVLVVISNNGAGIHTPYQQGSAAPCQSAWGLACQTATSSRPDDARLADYLAEYCPALPPQVQWLPSPKPGWHLIDGTDPVSVYLAAQTAMTYIRDERKPYLLEIRTERGRHHSSSSNPSGQIPAALAAWDPLLKFEQQLVTDGLYTPSDLLARREQVRAELMTLVEQVKQEPMASDAFSGLYYGN